MYVKPWAGDYICTCGFAGWCEGNWLMETGTQLASGLFSEWLGCTNFVFRAVLTRCMMFKPWEVADGLIKVLFSEGLGSTNFIFSQVLTSSTVQIYRFIYCMSCNAAEKGMNAPMHVRLCPGNCS